jgi:hypothetical protein
VEVISAFFSDKLLSQARAVLRYAPTLVDELNKAVVADIGHSNRRCRRQQRPRPAPPLSETARGRPGPALRADLGVVSQFECGERAGRASLS